MAGTIVQHVLSQLPLMDPWVRQPDKLIYLLGMKWITRDKLKTDQIACPWLIKIL